MATSIDNRIYVDMPGLMAWRYRTRGFSFGARQPVNSLLAGKHNSRIRGRGLSFEELRQYRVGDDIRNMDWKVTNRTGKPYVRVFDEEKERQVFLLIDQTQSMFFGSEARMKSVVAAELAALAGWRVLQAKDKVGAIVFNNNDASWFRAQRSHSHWMRILGEVVLQNQALNASAEAVSATTRSSSAKNTDSQQTLAADNTSPKMGLQKALQQLQKSRPQNALIIVISDFMQANSDWLVQMGQLRQHNDVVAAQVLDRLESELPEITRFVASDGELEMAVSGAEKKLVERYKAQFEQNLSQVRSRLAGHDIPMLQFNTVASVEQQVIQQLGAAMARAAKR